MTVRWVVFVVIDIVVLFLILILTLFNHIDEVNYRERQESRENSIVEILIKKQNSIEDKVSEVASGVNVISKKLSVFDIVSVNCIE